MSYRSFGEGAHGEEHAESQVSLPRSSRPTQSYSRMSTQQQSQVPLQQTSSLPSRPSSQAHPGLTGRSASEGDPVLRKQAQILARASPHLDPSAVARLRQELSKARVGESRPDVEVPQPPVGAKQSALTRGNPEWHAPFIRTPTTAERLLSLIRRHNPDAALRLSEDNETQLAAVAPEDKAFLFLLQRLTITLNPDYVFRTAHLGAHDYVSIDAFLRSDYHRMIRSYFTKEIILPDWADEQAAGYPYFTVFEIVQHLKGIRALTQELVEYLTQASQSHRSPDALALFVHIEHIHDLIHNIDHRNIKLLTHFQIYVFRGQQPPPQLVDLLAYYDVHWADLQEAAAAANAAVAEARTVLATLMDIHRSHLRESQFPEEQQGQLEQYPGTPHPLFEQLDQAQSSQQQQRERRPSSTSQPRTASPQSRASAPPSAQAAGAQPEAQVQQRARESLARPQAPPTEEYGRVEEVEQRPHVAQPLYPAGEPSTTRCFLCGYLHYTSSCRNYPSLKQRIKINAERGGCFKCGAVHREEHCASTLKCKGCQSKHHHTAFCAYNKNVIRDLDELEYGNYLKDAKAYAQYVRDKRRML